MRRAINHLSEKAILFFLVISIVLLVTVVVIGYFPANSASSQSGINAEYDRDLASEQTSHADGWVLPLTVLTFLSLTVTGVSVVTTLTVLRWRKVTRNGQHILIPDPLLHTLGQVQNDLSQYIGAIREQEESIRKEFHGYKHHQDEAQQAFHTALGQLKTTLQRLTDRQDETLKSTFRKFSDSTMELQGELRKDYQEVLEILKIFRKDLDKKDQEIDSLRKGAELEAQRNFLQRFLRLYNTIDQERSGQPAEVAGLMGKYLELFDDALRESSIERYQPEIGSDYRKTGGVADQPEQIETRDPDQHFTIEKILKPGFLVRTLNSDAPVYLQKSEVRIYVYKDSPTDPLLSHSSPTNLE